MCNVMKIIFSFLTLLFLNTFLLAQTNIKSSVQADSSKVVKIGDKLFIAYQSINKTNGSEYSQIRYENLNFENILFSETKWKVLPESFSKLNHISHLLKNNSNLSVVVTGFTDNIGSKRKNIKLSHKRALSAKKYLINTGIHPSRIVTKGLGDQHANCESPCAENRRVEFLVYGEGADLNKSWIKMYFPGQVSD